MDKLTVAALVGRLERELDRATAALETDQARGPLAAVSATTAHARLAEAKALLRELATELLY